LRLGFFVANQIVITTRRKETGTFVAALDRITATDAANRLIAMDDHYQTAPIHKGFNWDEAFADAVDGQWYLVVFRSRHAPTADEHLLNEFDRHAVEAAKLSPGFIYYFAGTPCPAGDCVSFCLWESQQAARNGAAHPAHVSATKLAPVSYEHYSLERYHVRKDTSGLSFEPVQVPAHAH
jgi:heme-degrading monooxygenase HmoA